MDYKQEIISREEQKKTIEIMIENVKLSIFEKINNESIPEDYNVLEFRIVISEYMARIVWGDMRGIKRKVHNDMITRGF